MDIGVKSDIMSDNIIGILGQRLVRKLRPNGKAPREAADIKKTLLDLEPATSLQLHDAVGCDKCEGIG